MAHEQDHYRAGSLRRVVELKGWKILPLVCYDLRFPVWSRNRIGSDDGYDLLLYVANWPERRRYPWQTLIKARAIENRATASLSIVSARMAPASIIRATARRSIISVSR